MARRRFAGATGSLLLLAACSTPHVRPEAKAGAQHERAASGRPEERPGLPCPAPGMRGGQACVEERRDETSERRDEAERERRRAAEHEAAAALRAAEERACRGVSEAEADDGPLLGGRYAFTAQPLIDFDDQATVLGVAIAFETGVLDADRLQGLVECHRARLANRGSPSAAHECPLDDPTLQAMVAATPRGTLLEIRSSDPAAARRAWERAKNAARAPRSAPPKRAPGDRGGS